MAGTPILMALSRAAAARWKKQRIQLAPTIPREMAIEAADAALPNSTVVVLPGQQHIAMDTNSQLFVGEVLDFLVA